MSTARHARLALERRATTLLVAPLVAVLVLGGCAGGEQTGDAAEPAGRASSDPTSPGAGSPEASAAESPEAESPEAESPASEPPPSEPSGGPSTQPRRPGRDGTVVTTAGSDFGPMLFDGTGQAIYLFDKETSPRPRCYGDCADAWPPVLTSGQPRARAQVDAGLLGTVRRRDGSTQVTYAGQPLYFYAHEGKGQVLCHDVVEYGGVWLVVTPGGTPAPS